MPKIAIIDYGMGNLRSVQKGFEHVGFKAVITKNPTTIKKASGIVLPGVGAFDAAIKNLRKLKLIGLIKEQIKSNKPFLGICLGFQLLFKKSEEGSLPGLGIFKGEVKRFKKGKIPQIGWNQVSCQLSVVSCQLFKDIPNNSYFYFVHSYYVEPKDKSIVAGTTNYGISYASAIAKENIWAVQFHPEKSSKLGLKILKNFGEICSK